MSRRVPAVLTAALLAHALPAATWLAPVRRLTPRTAGRGGPRHVALTLDDGPDAHSTPLSLDELARLGCHATFFVLGTMLHRAPWVGGRIAADGHEIAVHGWRHDNTLMTRPGRVTAEIRDTVHLIEDVCGVTPSWYRPPYGALSTEAMVAARRNGLRPVLWTAWGKDWTASATPSSVLQTLAPGLKGGATLLLHDSDITSAPNAWKSTLGALPEVVAECRAADLAVGPLRDHGVHP
ncbi:polysaccharide deacetylase family protein [Actinomadura sp. BRA 177]|uniref:polysaccharide deacetylase family protein n=1 Tax=Actinomadura sp. BRA 177 TaxID=2745202 RepID=UPI001596246A|nr:polysaccharide deacetylase family protein [Actinomadura sp. BRA 177]NVI87859.1 polysaccharide deacetylase family protein [Actinomadura sp. BRA 177]